MIASYMINRKEQTFIRNDNLHDPTATSQQLWSMALPNLFQVLSLLIKCATEHNDKRKRYLTHLDFVFSYRTLAGHAVVKCSCNIGTTTRSSTQNSLLILEQYVSLSATNNNSVIDAHENVQMLQFFGKISTIAGMPCLHALLMYY